MPDEVEFLLAVNGLRAPWLDRIVGALTDDGMFVYPLALLAVFAKRRSRETARSMRDGWLAFLLAIAVAEWLLKPIIARPRPTSVASLRARLDVLGALPPMTSIGMPSGTAAACFAGATWIAIRHGRGWGAGALVVAGLLSLTRLYVGVHYPSDVLVGALVGVGAALLVDRFTRWAGA